jgi:uncharacterized protein (DUF1778 family)
MPYVTQVATQLRAAAALGDDRTQEIAAGLIAAAESAVRLAVLGAVNAAAEEITAALLDADVEGSPTVTVTMDADEIRPAVKVSAPRPAESAPADDADASARISLRLSESLKAQIDEAAARQTVSVNTWLVRAATAALQAPRMNNPTGVPLGGIHRVTGWVTG